MNKSRWFSWLVPALALSALPAGATADGMRCNGRLVSTGDTTFDVLSLCGQPDFQNRRVEYRTLRHFVQGPCVQRHGRVQCGYVAERTVEVVIDEWAYDLGSNRFIRYLTFEQGQLRDVKTGRYGSK